MSVPVIGILVSGCMLACFWLLFYLEEKRGERFFSRIRIVFDRIVLRLAHIWTQISRYIGRQMVRQTLHYTFHRVLTALLRFLERLEKHVKRVLRTNKMVARKLHLQSDRPKNQLDEIAEHKQSVALTDAQKRKHRQRSLEG